MACTSSGQKHLRIMVHFMPHKSLSAARWWSGNSHLWGSDPHVPSLWLCRGLFFLSVETTFYFEKISFETSHFSFFKIIIQWNTKRIDFFDVAWVLVPVRTCIMTNMYVLVCCIMTEILWLWSNLPFPGNPHKCTVHYIYSECNAVLSIACDPCVHSYGLAWLVCCVSTTGSLIWERMLIPFLYTDYQHQLCGLSSPCGAAAVNSSSIHYHNASMVYWQSRWLKQSKNKASSDPKKKKKRRVLSALTTLEKWAAAWLKNRSRLLMGLQCIYINLIKNVTFLHKAWKVSF